MGDGKRMIIGEKPKRRTSAAAIAWPCSVDEEYQTPPSSNSSAAAPSPAPPIITCPCCGLEIKFNNHHHGFPAGVKFDPTDQQLLQHLEAKVHHKLHSLIDDFIPTVHQGIHLIHPLNLPGVSENGKNSHFFHRTSKPDTSGDGKRRKVDSEINEDRWREIGEARPIFIGDKLKGFKKMLVLYSNDGKQKELEKKTNWVRYQYHLIGSSNEEDGKLVVSKVFYVQTQPL